MSSIDRRIVEMQFNNRGFESGVRTTLASLKQLNEKLKMKDAGKGLEGISNAAGKVNLNGLSSGVDTVTARFSNLGVIGATVLMNLTNSAVNAGKRIANAFILEPITDGFGEYEQKMKSIATIRANTASKGVTEKQITAALNELNAYSDKTIYNFAQMTDGIGKFTAAGLGLKESVSAIKGIANLGAASGSNPQQVATMYWQMSQALAAGKVSLQDWNSVVNAGMGGEIFQNELKKTAKEMGVFVDENKSFRESISDGWLTSEILAKTFERMGNDKNMEKAATQIKTFSDLIGNMKEVVGSGWAQTFEHLFGGSEESTKLWTGISNAFENVVGKSAKARNDMLKQWKDLGGRDDIIKGFSNIFGSLGKVFGSVGKAFREVFPPMTGKKLADLSKGFKDFTEKLKVSDETAGKIKNTFKGVFSVFSTVGKAVGAVFKALSPLGSVFGGIGKIALSVTSGIGNFVSKIAEAIDKSNVFGKAADIINKGFSGVGKVIDGVGKAMSNLVKSMGKIDFGKIFGSIGKFLGNIGKGLSPIIDGIGKALGTINFNTILGGLGVMLAGGGFSKTLKKGMGWLEDIFGDTKSAFESIKDACKGVSDVLDSVRSSLEAYQKNLNASTLLKIAAAVGILAAALAVLSTIEPEQLGNSLAGIGTLFLELAAATAMLGKILDGSKMKGIAKVATSLLILSSAVLILASAMKQLSGLSWEEIGKGLLSITALMGVMIGSAKLMEGSGKGLLKTATSMVIFGLAIKLFASSIEPLAQLDPNALVQGLVGIGAVMAEIAAFSKVMEGAKVGLSNAASILIIAGALTVLANAVKSFGEMDLGALQQGLVGIGLILTELALFAKFGTASSGLISTAIGMTILSGAIFILSAAVKSLSSLSWEEIARGLTSMAGALLILGVSAALIPKSIAITAIGIGIMAGALLVLSLSLKALSGMSWEQIAKGLVTLAGALLILGVAAAAMTGCLLGAAAMVVMAGALALLTPQLILLGSMSIQQVATGLIALAGAFAVIGVAGLLLAPVAPIIVLLAGAMVLLGVACLGIGAGVMLFGQGLQSIANAVSSFGSTILDFIQGLGDVISDVAPKIGQAAMMIATGIISVITTIAGLAGQFISAGIQLVTGLITGIISMAAGVGTAIKGLFDKAKSAVSNVGSMLTSAGKSMITGLINGIKGMVSSVGSAVKSAITTAKSAASGAASTLVSAGRSLITGLVNGIKGMISAVSGAIKNVLNTAKSAASSAASTLVSAGRSLITGFVRGIKGMIGSVTGAVRSIINSCKSAARGAASALVSAGRSLITGFISGIKSAAGRVAAAARGVVQNAINAAKSALKINSPSKVFIKIGASVNEGFALGLTRYSDECIKPAADMANKVIETAKKPLGALAKILHEDVDTTPVIAPVMDLSNVKDGARTLGSMLSDTSMNIAGVSGGISKSIGRIQNGNLNEEIVSAISDLKNSLSNLGNTTYQVNGITYDDGSNITNAVETLVRAARVERRI